MSSSSWSTPRPASRRWTMTSPTACAAHEAGLLVVNKADNPRREHEGGEFYALGFDPTLTISAQHGRNTGDLADEIVDRLPPAAPSVPTPEAMSDEDLAELAETEMGPPKVAIVGRPNTGKSTFVNRVLGEERMIVSKVPGTTRDPIDTEITLDGRADDAHRHRRHPPPRRDRPRDRALLGAAQPEGDRPRRRGDRHDRCDRGLHRPGCHVVGYVLDAGKGIVLVINKWDAVEKDEFTADRWLKRLRRDAPYLAWADIVFASALSGQRVQRILQEARRVAEERFRRVSTGELNRLVMDAVRAHPPSHVRNRLPKILYATQVAIGPPTFVIFVNDPELIHFSYKRYLENRIREEWGFLGTPIRLIFRQRESVEDARRSAKPRRRTAKRR